MPTLRDAEKYVGMAYDAACFDCADLAVLVQREVFDRVLDVPGDRARPGGVRGQAREIRHWRTALAYPVARPATGCAVLLLDGPQECAVHWHIGTVFVSTEGEVWVLHASRSLGSVALQRLRDLQCWGLAVEGYYAWM